MDVIYERSDMPTKALLTPQRQRYKNKRDSLNKFNADINKTVLDRAKYLRESDPSYSEFGIKPSNRGYIKNKNGAGIKVFEAIADILVSDKAGNKTQVEILKQVQQTFPTIFLQPNIWHRELYAHRLKKIQERINCNLVKPISFNGCKTLSEIKARMRAKQNAQTATQTYTPKIAINKEVVVINDKSFPIERRKASDPKSASIRVNVLGKRQWIRLDALMAFLSSK
ncbi:MAG: hypothetical protein PW788_09100 [Micavibrio sp.]|nr:hypothetical protein [Micavibrio sp.]